MQLPQAPAVQRSALKHAEVLQTQLQPQQQQQQHKLPQPQMFQLARRAAVAAPPADRKKVAATTPRASIKCFRPNPARAAAAQAQGAISKEERRRQLQQERLRHYEHLVKLLDARLNTGKKKKRTPVYH